MRLDVFGRHVEVLRRDRVWKVYYLGNDGKKRLADDIVIPDNISEAEVKAFVDDLCHEWATVDQPSVTII